MKYKVRGKNVEITEAMNSHLEGKLTKLDKYFINYDELEASVLVRIYPETTKVEITIPTKSFTLRIEEEHGDIYTAFDHAIDKLERQIRKNKTRLQNRSRGKDISQFSFDYDSNTDEINEVVKTKTLELKPMDIDEAVLQMELINHDFFVFHDIDINGVSVVYRRNDGTYGVLETK
ncbi:MAG: ribosome hibernation-promoting factor, HPF/YfiA family [Bacilli bacterium]